MALSADWAILESPNRIHACSLESCSAHVQWIDVNRPARAHGIMQLHRTRGRPTVGDQLAFQFQTTMDGPLPVFSLH